MADLATIAQAVAVVSACWAIISGVGAWKREFIGKRRIDLAEQLLAKFFEVKDAVRYIRNPWSSVQEGKIRERAESESSEESQLLDRAFVVVERYQEKERVFAEFNTLKYRCMASFGPQTETIFADTNRAVNSVFVSARLLATHYWKRQGRVPMTSDEFEKHLEGMRRHEGIFYDLGSEDDEIRRQLEAVQKSLETVTAPCFQEAIRLYSLLTRKIGFDG